jgi:hypothetical protein
LLLQLPLNSHLSQCKVCNEQFLNGYYCTSFYMPVIGPHSASKSYSADADADAAAAAAAAAATCIFRLAIDLLLLLRACECILAYKNQLLRLQSTVTVHEYHSETLAVAAKENWKETASQTKESLRERNISIFGSVAQFRVCLTRKHSSTVSLSLPLFVYLSDNVSQPESDTRKLLSSQPADQSVSVESLCTSMYVCCSNLSLSLFTLSVSLSVCLSVSKSTLEPVCLSVS